MAEFSIDDVYKQAPAAAKGGEISLDEAYGGKTPGLSGGTKPEPQGRSAGDWAMRSVKDIPAIADMVLGLPGMGLQLGAEALGRLHGVIEGGLAGMSGKDPQARKRADAYGVAAKESVPESFSAPLQTLLKTFGLDASGSNLEAVMGTAMTAMHKGGQYVERVTKGGVTAEDSDMLLNTLMFSLGAKGVGGQLKKAMEPKPPEGQFKGPYKGKLDPPKPPKPETPETPPPFEPYGVRQPAGMPTTEASKAQTAQRRADVRAAFAEEPQWADYLKRQADYQAETLAKREAESTRLTPEESAPRTRPPERTSVDDAPKDLYTTKGAPNKGPQPGYVQNPAGLWVPDTRSPELKVAGSALDSGLAKLGQGRGFDLTAAERLAVNKSGSSWNRPGIVLPAAGAAALIGSQYLSPERGHDALVAAGFLGIIAGGGNARVTELAAKVKESSQAALQAMKDIEVHHKDAAQTLHEDWTFALESGEPSTWLYLRDEMKMMGYPESVVGKLNEAYQASRELHHVRYSEEWRSRLPKERLAELNLLEQAKAHANSLRLEADALDAAHDVPKDTPPSKMNRSQKYWARESYKIWSKAEEIEFQVDDPLKWIKEKNSEPPTPNVDFDGLRKTLEGSKTLSAGKRTQMFGGADQNTMVGLATLGLGAVVGANLDKDNPIIGALLGMTGAAGAKYVGTKGAVSLAKAVVGDNKGRAAATITSGALAGYVVSDDKNKTSGTILGALAVGAARALPKYTGLRIGQELNARDYLAQSFNVEAMRLQFGILDKVPDVERLKAIWRANEPGGSAKDLSPAEREVAQAFRTYYAGMDKAAKEAGVYKEGLDNYMARLHDLDPKSVEFELQKLFDKTGKNGGNPFSKERRFLTLEDAKKAGYTPITENPVEMLGIYANSMGKAIADRNLVKGLMEKNVPESKDAKYVMAEKYAPRTYVSMPGAAMGGKRVHPDLEGSLKFVFESRNPSAALRAVETFNAATKRIAVMVSLFHAKSLLDAAVGAVKVNKGYLLGGAAVGGMAGLLADDPTTGAQIGAGLGMLASVGKTGGLAATGTLKYLQELKRGGQGGVIERAMKGGLEFSMEKHPSIVEDMGGGNFYAGMADAGKLLDKTLEGAGKHTFGNLIKVNQIFDNFMWARLHTGLKLNVFDEKFNTIKENNARAHEKAPNKVKLLGEDEIAHIAGSFTNDTFGGLNWRRIAEGAETRLGRAVGEAVLSPTGRRAQQLLMFAPDWTLSTTRAFTGAFGEGSGIKGLLNPRELADLHRQYIIRSALFYALAGDGINYAMSGHHLWDNRDWTRLELGDGRTMQFSKHMMEPYHWLMHPAQQAMNKLSHPVKETANQALKTEYLAPRTNRNGEQIAGPAMKGTRVEHLVGSVSPIAAQQSANSGAVGGAAGFLGFPIYGQTTAQREEEKRKRQLERIKEQVK